MNNNIIFYCLNFHPNRTKTIKERFNSLNINCNFYQGVTFDDPRISNDICNHEKKCWSCMFGHLDMISKFLNSNKEFGIFCEDDIYINKDLPNLLPTISKHFRILRLDVLLLGYLLEYKIENNTNNTNNNLPIIFEDNEKQLSYHKCNTNIWGTQMYMMSRSHAEYILNKYTPDYAVKSIHDKNITFSADWTLTKDGNNMLFSPIMAIEDNTVEYENNQQQIFHKNCFKTHFNPEKFLPPNIFTNINNNILKIPSTTFTSKTTTFITCLFDCCKTNNYNFQNSIRTLLIEQPLIIFCEEKYSKKYYEFRKTLGFENITKIITMKLEDFNFYIYRNHIENFKNITSYNTSTPEYYILLFCQFEMVLKSIQDNIFNTSHFCWLNISLLTETFNNSINYLQPNIYDKLNEIAQNPRDKFAIQIINSWNKNNYENLSDFFNKSQWLVSSFFYTIDLNTGLFILPKLIQKTIELLNMNYCQHNETIFAFIIDDYEDYFNLYIGDYQDSIHNYYIIDKNNLYVEDIINLNIEKGNHKRVYNILTEYKKFYISKHIDFPYQKILTNLQNNYIKNFV